MSKPAIRTLFVVLATVFAIAVPAIQALADFGLSAGEFSYQGDQTLRAAGYAFAIWSVIYAGLVLYAVWQALPRTPESPLLRAVAWPSVIAIAGCGVWILVTAVNWRWASVLVILVTTACAILAIWRAAPETVNSRRWIVLWPLGLLAGWLTAATALNIVTVATMEGLVGAPTATALVTLAAVAMVALAVIARTRSLPYALALIWALIGVFVAQQAGKPTVAWVAVGLAVLVALAWGGLRLRSGRR
ncbi:MAG TPA: hypothetical protein VF138_08495 [Caulobacteraceae bacterium]